MRSASGSIGPVGHMMMRVYEAPAKIQSPALCSSSSVKFNNKNA